MEKIKVFLDDERLAPNGWIPVRWPHEAIRWLEQGLVESISLDHDLGDDTVGTGYDVLKWIEKRVVLYGYVPPEILIHTANPAARLRMLAALDQIEKLVQRNKDANANQSEHQIRS